LAKVRHSFGIVIALILLGSGLRAGLLTGAVRFHPDEASYASFARAFAVRGDWLLTGNLDKPPLALWGQAVLMATVGVTLDDNGLRQLDLLQGEFTARLWSFYASVFTLAVGYRLARDTLSPTGGMWTLAGLSLSPLLIVFSATAFTDSPMILFGMLAMVMAWRKRPLWAGLCLALAYGNKQQAIVFVPLVVAFLAVRFRGWDWRAWTRFVLGSGSILILLVIYDGLRPDPSIFALATQHNQPERWLVTWWELPTRAVAWWEVARWAAIGLMAMVFPLRLPTVPMRLMRGWLIAYVLLHMLTDVRIYDRYVLLIEPFLLLTAVAIVHQQSSKHAPLILGGVWVAMLPIAVYASTAQLPIGGDRGKHDGIIELAHYVNEREFGAIVYDRWLGWELNYYLGEWTDKRRAYYPTPFALLKDPALLVADVAPRYFPAPSGVAFGAWQQAFESLGFVVCEGYRQTGFVVYVLLERDQLEDDPRYHENALKACPALNTPTGSDTLHTLLQPSDDNNP